MTPLNEATCTRDTFLVDTSIIKGQVCWTPMTLVSVIESSTVHVHVLCITFVVLVTTSNQDTSHFWSQL